MRHELLDGTLLVSPPPSVPQQLAARRLVAALGAAAPPDIEVLEAGGRRADAGPKAAGSPAASRRAVRGACRPRVALTAPPWSTDRRAQPASAQFPHRLSTSAGVSHRRPERRPRRTPNRRTPNRRTPMLSTRAFPAS